ncbi:Tim10/DDP family zinc finger domain containing protein, partial [Amanita muscaria]
MSFLGRGGSVANNGGVNSEKIDMAMTELDTVTDFFNRMVNSCYAKCISQRFTEGDLTKGENVCIDRCVSKYNEVQKKIGEKLQAKGAASA